MVSGRTRQKASWDNWYRWKEHQEWQWHGRHAPHLRDMVHTQICRLQLQRAVLSFPSCSDSLVHLGSWSGEQSPGWRPWGKFHPSPPHPWASGVGRKVWLFPTSILFSRMQQALWKPGSLGLSISLWYLTCQLCISAGNLKCNRDIIIIITGKWAKDSWLSTGFLLSLAIGIPWVCSAAIILPEHITSAQSLFLGFIKHIIKLLRQVNWRSYMSSGNEHELGWAEFYSPQCVLKAPLKINKCILIFLF